jgi:hypothetical protein
MSKTETRTTGPATFETLQGLHAELAKTFIAHLKKAQAGKIALRASWLAEVRKFLRDNNIQAAAGMGGLLTGLEELKYPFK